MKNKEYFVDKNRGPWTMQAVTFEQGKRLAADHNVRFLETSARSNTNVTEAFEGLATDVIRR